LFDYWDSYLAQYEIAFKGSNASGVMCSYTAENGHPSCANGYILNDVLREKWGQTNAVVTTDCTAVKNAGGACQCK
jgi:beta-glucosidase-like glycosyl hydrolase